MKVYNNIDELIGNTPLLYVNDCFGEKLYGNVYAKLECMNPAGSVKDRAALYMINKAEKDGILKKGSVIIEPTSGNTGIGLAAISASRGYKVILTMPDSMSMERRKLLAAYGAEIVLTDGAKGMAGAIEEAEKIAAKTPNSFIVGQFTNNANKQAHYSTTGPEIYADMDGKVDIFVAGVGTGGTFSGAAGYLKEKNGNIINVAVEPADSPLLTKGKFGPHPLQGIGANFVPEILETDLIDEIITVSGEQAFSAARSLAKNKGVLVGISSGAALYAAICMAKRKENSNKNIVVILPDTGDRYLSTALFE